MNQTLKSLACKIVLQAMHKALTHPHKEELGLVFFNGDGKPFQLVADSKRYTWIVDEHALRGLTLSGDPPRWRPNEYQVYWKLTRDETVALQYLNNLEKKFIGRFLLEPELETD